MAVSYRPDIFFKADHAFVFAIKDSTKTLFMGRFNN